MFSKLSSLRFDFLILSSSEYWLDFDFEFTRLIFAF